MIYRYYARKPGGILWYKDFERETDQEAIRWAIDKVEMMNKVGRAFGNEYHLEKIVRIEEVVVYEA
jgi:hypothetical protein